MPIEYTGTGDARRSLELLWGVRRTPSRGPKPGLSVERIVAAAIDLADREGMAALSMRRVADGLKASPMSLYTYVPGKGELLDLMIDTVFGEQAEALEEIVARVSSAADGADPGPRWRAGLEERARIDWTLFQRHAWLAQVSSSRAVLGPNETMVLDRSLRIVAGIGLTAREMVAVVDALALYVTGAARHAVEIAEGPGRTGKTDDEWWLERAPLMEELYDWSRFPTLVEVSAAAGFDEPPGTESYLAQFLVDDFEFGLQRMLDGIASFVAGRPGGQPEAP
jgi:AcrR family transcriptional regulator